MTKSDDDRQRQGQHGEDGEDPLPMVQRRRRAWLVILVATTFAALVTAGVLWWQELPLRRAQAYLETGDVRKALSWSEFYLSYHPHDGRAQSIKAQALVGVGRPADAIELFNRAGVRALDDTYIFARAFMMQEEWTKALPLLLRVLELDPKHPDALYEATTCRIRLTYLNDALETAERYAALPGYEARGQMLVAIILADLENFSGSVRAFEQAIELSPDGEDWLLPREEALQEYSAILLKSGRALDAVNILNSCQQTPAVCAALGDAYLQAGDLDNAVTYWEKTLESDPTNIFAREGLARVMLQQNQPEKALEYLEPLKYAVNLKASGAYLLQMAYQRVDPVEAEKWRARTADLRRAEERQARFTRALIQAPRSPAAMLIRAHKFASARNYAEAEAIATALLEILPKDPLIQDLVTAIQERTELPSLDRMPIDATELPKDDDGSSQGGASGVRGEANAVEAAGEATD